MRKFHFLSSTAAILLVCGMIARAANAADDGWLRLAQRLSPGGTAVDFTPHGTQPGLAYDLAPAQECEGCHGGNGNAASFRPAPTWAGSMMANATRDPVFFAALDVANHDVPGVGDYCLRCHTSRGWYRGHVVKTGFGNSDNDVALGANACLLTGGYDWQDDLDNDYSGLPCHFCHRLSDSGPGGAPPLIGNANVWIDDEPCANPNSNDHSEPCRRGPYDYVLGSGPPHEWQYSAYHTESRLCGACHDVTTPDTSDGPLKTLKLANGVDTGRSFPIERTYSEWQQSRYSNTAAAEARTCQACHMPISEDPDATACLLSGYPNRQGNLSVHAFVGGNTWVPALIKGEYADTSSIPGSHGGVGRQSSFDQTIAWARQMLADAAQLDTTIASYTPPASGNAGSLGLQVKVTNRSGHKLPTGYGEGRRMWLSVEVHDANGALVFRSGAYDAATGVLTRDTQLRVYEILQGIWNRNGGGTCDAEDAGGRPIFHFALNDCIAKDNRIPPLGFHPATATDPDGYELNPVGTTYPETAPGSGILVNHDVATYAVSVPSGSALPLTATARLYYQTASRDYVEFLRDEALANGTPGENDLCAGGSNRPFVVGPKDSSRGQYLYELWNDGPEGRIFASGFEATVRYGKSPPELMQVSSATTP